MLATNWAPAAPTPARMVTRFPASSRAAASRSAAPSGRETARVGRTTMGDSSRTALARKTSPGTTTAATPYRSTAARMASSRMRGADSAVSATSAWTLHPRNSSPAGCGRVSWK